MNKLALYCRIGFEKEVAAEITDRASERGVFGFARVVENSGYVIFECYQPGDADRLAREIPFNRLIFARQMIVVSDLLENLDPQDRISPILAQYERIAEDINLKQAVELFVETADTNEAKELSTFCRKFTVPLRQALKKQGWLQGKPNVKRGQILHCFFTQPNCCYVGYSYLGNNSTHFMGIPRLKFPADVPSRSTLKLEEVSGIVDKVILLSSPINDSTLHRRLKRTFPFIDLIFKPLAIYSKTRRDRRRFDKDIEVGLIIGRESSGFFGKWLGDYNDGYIEIFPQNSLTTEDETISLMASQFFGGENNQNQQNTTSAFQRAEEKALKVIENNSMIFKGIEKNREIFNAYILLAKARVYQGKLFDEHFGYSRES